MKGADKKQHLKLDRVLIAHPKHHAGKARAWFMRRTLAMNEKLDQLRRQLDQKTTEIETAVAAERGIGSIENMDSLTMSGCNRTLRNCWSSGKKLLNKKVQGAWTIPH